MRTTLIISFLFLASHVFCQKGSIYFSAGPAMAFPVANSNYNYYYKKGIGFMPSVQYQFSKTGSIQFSANYFKINTKKNSPNTSDFHFWTLLAGIRNDFDFGVFTALSGGICTLNSSKDRFAICPELGYSIKLKQPSYIDILVKYNRISNSPFNNQWFLIGINYRVRIK